MKHAERYAEAGMERFWQHKEAGDFDSALTLVDSLGYNPEAVSFTFEPDSYYFPNRRGDRFVKPASVGAEKIPIVTLENGREYKFRKPSLHHLQRAALKGYGLQSEHFYDIAENFSTYSNTLMSSDNKAATASVYRNLLRLNVPEPTYISSAPTVIFNVDPAEPNPEPLCPSVPLHEFVHVAQSLSNPFYQKSEQLRDELIAYAAQATLLSKLGIDYTGNLAMAVTVDAFRKRHLGHDTFEPTPDFTEAFCIEPSMQNVWNSVKL